MYATGMSMEGSGGAENCLDIATLKLKDVKDVEVENKGADAVAEPWEES